MTCYKCYLIASRQYNNQDDLLMLQVFGRPNGRIWAQLSPGTTPIGRPAKLFD